MHHSTAFLPPPTASSPSAAYTAATPDLVKSKRPPVSSPHSVQHGSSSARGAAPKAAQSHSGGTASQQQMPTITQASPNDMEDYLHWAFGRTPAQILQQPIVTGHAPVYTEDQHAGGWLDTVGTLHLRQHGVNSLPSGACCLRIYLGPTSLEQIVSVFCNPVTLQNFFLLIRCLVILVSTACGFWQRRYS